MRTHLSLRVLRPTAATSCGSSCPPSSATLLRTGTSFRYLRLSVTDRCNLRCTYCMPPDATFLPHAELLTMDEQARMVQVLSSCGVNKVRITGGEPLLRRDLPSLIERIAQLPAIRELALTSNALLLAKQAHSLAAAGLQRVNISLDSLDPARFTQITRGGRVRDVLAGIEAACRAGLTPIKLNVVVMRDWNAHELPRFAELALQNPIEVRFIERMPIGPLATLGHFVSEAEMREQLRDYALCDLPYDGAPARRASIARGGLRGSVGFISPMSRPFCESCDRLRLTADGQLRACLFDADGVDVRALLRSGASDAELSEALSHAAQLRPAGHVHGAAIDAAAMNRIGG